MIPEYKRYHGAVFAEIVDAFPGPVSIEEWPEKGRISSYVLNDRIGLHIKHSGSRMRPWMFTVTTANFEDIEKLRERCDHVFIVLVCWIDGIVCIDDFEFQEIVSLDNGRSWLRAERRKGELYTVSGSRSELAGKRANGVAPILEVLGVAASMPSSTEPPRNSSSWLKRLLMRWWGGSAD